MPVEWTLSKVVPIFKENGDIRNCSCYSCETSWSWNEGGGKGVRERLCRIVTVDEIQFGLVSERGTIDGVLILRRLQEEYHVKESVVYVFCGSRERF